jgi:hypothetical protein
MLCSHCFQCNSTPLGIRLTRRHSFINPSVNASAGVHFAGRRFVLSYEVVVNVDRIRTNANSVIITGIARVNEPIDPNVCGCRDLLCCEQSKHVPAKFPHHQQKRCGVSGRNTAALLVARITSGANVCAATC